MFKCLFLILIFWVQSVFAQETICYKIKINPTQEPSVISPRCRIVGDVFYFDGIVDETMYGELRDRQDTIKTVELNSFGGLVSSAYKIAELIRNKKMATNVRKEARCGSACTLIFQAGVHRTAHPSSRFLYHGARLMDGWFEYWLEMRYEKSRFAGQQYLKNQFQEVQDESQKFFLTYINYGMNPEFIKMYQALDDSETWFEDGNFGRTRDLFMPAMRLINYNIVQDLDFRTEFSEAEAL